MLFALPLTARAADAPSPVETGRDALKTRKYPWYDNDKDAVRPVTLPPLEKDPKKATGNPATPGTSDVTPVDGDDGSRRPKETSEIDPPDIDIPSGALSGLSAFAWFVLILLVSSIIAGLIYLFMQNRRQKPLDKATSIPLRSSEHDPTEALPAPARKHVGDLLAEARRCYQEGRYGEAIVFLFSHELLELDRSQMIRLARGKTNRQYLTEVGDRPTLRELMSQSMVVFEDSFFGGYPIERQRFEACWTQLDAFQRLVQGGAA